VLLTDCCAKALPQVRLFADAQMPAAVLLAGVLNM
jgi:hypothetical protein